MNIKYIKKTWALVILCGIYGFAAQCVSAQTSASSYTVGKRYNLLGQVTGIISPDPDGSGGLRRFAAVRNSYNSQGLLGKVERGVLNDWQSDEVKPINWTGFTVNVVQVFNYDDWGRKLIEKTQSAAGNVLRINQYSYDSVGRLSCMAVRMNPAQFNSLPVSACSLGATGVNGPDRITKYNYNAQDLVTSVVKAYGTELVQTYVTYTYNSFWEKETIKDANGNLSKMIYDGFGRLKQLQFPSKTAVGNVNTADYEAYSYDLNDNRTSLRKRGGDSQTIYYTFDNLNRVKTKDLPGTTDDVSYNYDNRGLELSSTFDSTGKGIATSYDGFGRAKTSTNSMLASSKQLSYEYDDNGNRTKLTHPDNIFFGYAYDGTNKLTNVCENGSAQAASAQTSMIALRCAEVAKEVISPIYDNFDRLASIVLTGGGLTGYGYDDINRLSAFSHNLSGSTYDVAASFTYNPASQVISRTIDNDVFAYKENKNIVGSYVANGLNQYTTVNGKSNSHDSNGNLTYDGSTETTYGYDIENRLTSVSGSKTATLKYDPKGRLYEIVSGGVTKQFLYDGDSLVAEYDGNGAMLNRYVHGSRVDEPYLWYQGSAVNSANRRNLYADYQGSIVAITNSAASVVGVNSYDIYGIPGASNTGRFSYTGQIYLPEVGLYYYKARMYSPLSGRFLQTDPIGYKDQMNLYAYVGNDPTNKNDPMGLYSCDTSLSSSQCSAFTAAQDTAIKQISATMGVLKSIQGKLASGGTLTAAEQKVSDRVAKGLGSSDMKAISGLISAGTKMLGALQGNAPAMLGSGNGNSYAETKNGGVVLHPAFFNQTAKNTVQNQAATVTHESAHFTIRPGQDPFYKTEGGNYLQVYGQSLVEKYASKYGVGAALRAPDSLTLSLGVDRDDD